MKDLMISLVLVGLLALFPATAHSAGQLRLLCSASTEWCDFVATAFSSATGTQVALTKRSSGEALQLLTSQRGSPQFDVWYGGTGDPHMQAADLHLTMVYRSRRLGELHDWSTKQARQAGWRTVGIYSGQIGIAFNNELLQRLNLPAPTCWKDLLNPALKGRIALANPGSSGTAYTMLATLVQVMGEEQAFGYMKQLHRNVNQYSKSGSAPLQAVSKGEAVVSVSFLHDVPNAKLTGAPVSAHAPCEGTGSEIGSMSIVEGARNEFQAKAFYEWALDALTQQFGMALRQFQMPSNRGVLLDRHTLSTKQMKLIDYDYARYGSAAERQRLLARWEREVLGREP